MFIHSDFCIFNKNEFTDIASHILIVCIYLLLIPLLIMGTTSSSSLITIGFIMSVILYGTFKMHEIKDQ